MCFMFRNNSFLTLLPRKDIRNRVVSIVERGIIPVVQRFYPATIHIV